MNWDATGAVAELLGALGVIITLIYLARQIVQTNRIGQASVVRELQQRYHELYELVASDVGVAELAAKLTDPDYRAQSEVEEQRLQNLAGMVAGMYFSAQTAYEQGQMDEYVYQIYCEDVTARLVQWPALKCYLQKVIGRWPSVVSAKPKILGPIFD
jgi:hypothetical protein